MKRLFGLCALLLTAVSAALGQAPDQSAPPKPRVRLIAPSFRLGHNRHTVRVNAVSTEPRVLRSIESDPMATTERAERDLQRRLAQEVTVWLAADGVPTSWRPSPQSIRRLLVEKPRFEGNDLLVNPDRNEYSTVYRAIGSADFSPAQKARLVAVYHRQVAGQRLGVLAGCLAFVLACLAAMAGYIRADEATKGYYTNRLRMAAAAGVGAAGVVVYQILT